MEVFHTIETQTQTAYQSIHTCESTGIPRDTDFKSVYHSRVPHTFIRAMHFSMGN